MTAERLPSEQSRVGPCRCPTATRPAAWSMTVTPLPRPAWVPQTSSRVPPIMTARLGELPGQSTRAPTRSRGERHQRCRNKLAAVVEAPVDSRVPQCQSGAADPHPPVTACRSAPPAARAFSPRLLCPAKPSNPSCQSSPLRQTRLRSPTASPLACHARNQYQLGRWKRPFRGLTQPSHFVAGWLQRRHGRARKCNDPVHWFTVVRLPGCTVPAPRR